MAYVPCIADNCNCRFIDIPGNLDVVQNFKDFELEYVGQFAYDILDFQMCDVNDILELLSELLKNFDCVNQNLIGWLEDLYKRDFNPVSSKSIAFSKTQSWQDGVEIVNFTGDVKASKFANNGITIRDDGVWAPSPLTNGYKTINKSVETTISWSKFKLAPGALGDFRIYYTGVIGEETYIELPVGEMDLVDTANVQCKVVGGFRCMKTVDIQEATKVGDKYRMNIDIYLLMHGKTGPASPVKDVKIEVQIIGRKKVI